VDTQIDLNAGATKNEVLNAIKGHILAKGQLMGRATAGRIYVFNSISDFEIDRIMYGV
jgi:hypothetical protein